MNGDFRSELKKRVLAQTAALAIVLGILALCLVIVVRLAEDSSKAKNLDAELPSGLITMIGDVKCEERPNIETYLIIGTDRVGELTDVEDKIAEDTIRSDTLLLLIIDKVNDTYAVVPINRNTMMPVRGLKEDGEIISTSEIQVSFAYAGGYSREQSCENVVWSISEFFYGLHIDHYAAFSLSAIGVLNHAVGGVEVEIVDDFSRADPSLVVGETIKLSDEQADAFVHGRMDVDDGTNENRMNRQAVFMDAWSKQMKELCTEDEQIALDLYDALGSYMYTDIQKSDISKLLKAYLKNEDLGVFEIDGKVDEDDVFGWATFTPDEKSKQEIALELMFDPVE